MRNLNALALAAALAAPGVAFAQEAGPSPDEIKAKILEIHRLMKGAEEALARSSDTRDAAERSAEAARKMLDEKAKQETGKSAEELRKLAEGGSKEAAETLERLTKAAGEELKAAVKKLDDLMNGGGGASGSAGGSSAGIKKLIDEIKGQGQGASSGIKWLLEKAGSKGGGGGGGGDPKPKEKQPDAPEPKSPEKEKKPEKPSGDPKKPESKTEPPRSPEFTQWYAELPPQVRKAYETEDWDSIPPKWREMLKEWTKKMADEKTERR